MYLTVFKESRVFDNSCNETGDRWACLVVVYFAENQTISWSTRTSVTFGCT